MNLDQTHQVLEPIATRAFDYGDFVLDRVRIHVGWIRHRCSHRLFVSCMNGQTGCPEEPMRVDRAMETEGVSTTSQSFEFSHAEMASSSSFSHKVANKIGVKNPKHPTGWISTSVDILDKGRVPILFSVEQMRNLRMNIEHTPAGEFLTCPVFGLKR